MINVLRNSVKFTLEGEIKLSIRKNNNQTGIELEIYDKEKLPTYFGKLITNIINFFNIFNISDDHSTRRYNQLIG